MIARTLRRRRSSPRRRPNRRPQHRVGGVGVRADDQPGARPPGWPGSRRGPRCRPHRWSAQKVSATTTSREPRRSPAPGGPGRIAIRAPPQIHRAPAGGHWRSTNARRRLARRRPLRRLPWPLTLGHRDPTGTGHRRFRWRGGRPRRPRRAGRVVVIAQPRGFLARPAAPPGGVPAPSTTILLTGRCNRISTDLRVRPKSAALAGAAGSWPSTGPESARARAVRHCPVAGPGALIRPMSAIRGVVAPRILERGLRPTSKVQTVAPRE